MIIGIPKETKSHEYRVAAPPVAVQALVQSGHTVRVETGAGVGSGFDDVAYRAAGADIVATAAEAWAPPMVLKVKEPTPAEYGFLRDDLVLFTFLHLAADRPLTEALLAAGTTAIAYETVQYDSGAPPLLTPMSEVAGRMATQVGAHYLSRFLGGRGLLLGGVPGVKAGNVAILGGGTVGTNAAKMAVGLGAHVTLLDIDHDRLQYLDDVFGGRVQTLMSHPGTIAETVAQADLVIGGVLIVGARAPHLVTRPMLGTMRPGSVIVDVSVDQGGCVETIRPTTHDAPTYLVDGIVHYGVANMPGAVPNTSTLALANQTLRYAMRLADDPWEAMRADRALARGLNTFAGQVTHRGVGEAFELPWVAPSEVLPS